MNRKKNPKIAAVIDIGSNMLQMHIAQLKKGEIEELDHLEYPLHLGHEVFNNGKISFESLRELSEVLHGYTEIMQGYGVEQVRVVATTALREAENRAYVADQLHIQNNFTVQILEDDQEKTLIYSEMLRSLQNMQNTKIENALLSYIGTGSIGIALYDGKNVIQSQNISIGSLKLHDVLREIQDKTEDFHVVVEEYLDAILDRIEESYSMVTNLVLTGSEVELIAHICAISPVHKRYLISTSQIRSLYTQICSLSPDKIAEKYDITAEEAKILYSALAIYNRLLRFSKSEFIISPIVDVWDSVMRHILLPKSVAEYEEHLRGSALTCAYEIAEKYECSENHSKKVHLYACKIFDKLKPVHGLDKRKCLLLELAIILHDCGHYVNTKQHTQSSYDLIKNLDIYGLTLDEMKIVAYISRYNEYSAPDFHDVEFISMSDKKRIVISKLAAIFRLANSLDKSQKQKLSDIKVKLEKNKLLISGSTNEDTTLEKWAFSLCCPFFKEVFGIDPELIVRMRTL